MKKNLLKIALALLLVIFLSCNSQVSSLLTEMFYLYGGELSIKTGTRVTLSRSNEHYYKILCNKITLVDSRKLNSENMANNCAILAFQSDSDAIKKADVLEIEIAEENQSPHEFNLLKIATLTKDYPIVEKSLIELVHHVQVNDLANAKAAMISSIETSNDTLTSSLKVLKTALSSTVRDVKIIGYRILNSEERRFEINFMIIAEDNTRKILKATTVAEADSLKFNRIAV